MPRGPYSIFTLCAVAIFVGGCPVGGLIYEEDLANGYAVWATDTIEDAAIVHRDKGRSAAREVIHSMVFAYGWNDDFIIAKQHPEKDGKIDTSMTNWYILEVASGKVHGPMREDEFSKLGTKLKVPAELSFKTVRLNADN